MLTSDILIRPAEIGDIPDLMDSGRQFYEYAELEGKGLNFHPGRFCEHLYTLMEGRLRCCFVAEKDGEFCGSVAGSVITWFLDNSQYVLTEHWWWVLPEYRKTEAGKMLRQQLRAWGQEQGVEFILMSAFPDKRDKAIARMYRGDGLEPFQRTFLGRLG
jgi:GNAT superfamily N-acetyltransferase